MGISLRDNLPLAKQAQAPVAVMHPSDSPFGGRSAGFVAGVAVNGPKAVVAPDAKITQTFSAEAPGRPKVVAANPFASLEKPAPGRSA